MTMYYGNQLQHAQLIKNSIDYLDLTLSHHSTLLLVLRGMELTTASRWNSFILKTAKTTICDAFFTTSKASFLLQIYMF